MTFCGFYRSGHVRSKDVPALYTKEFVEPKSDARCIHVDITLSSLGVTLFLLASAFKHSTLSLVFPEFHS